MVSTSSLAKQALSDCEILEVLKNFSPKVVSTICVGFDIAGSDIDILCARPSFPEFKAVFEKEYSNREGYELLDRSEYVVGRFESREFLIEVFVSNTPVNQQPAYRHFKVMKRLSTLGGKPIQAKVRAIKETGLKTEPAIAALLGLPGDPYQAVLDLESTTDQELQARIHEVLA